MAAVLILMRSPSAEPALGSDWLIKAVVAAIIGGLGSFTGAVVGGLGLGLAEVMFRGYLPEGVFERLTDAFVFVLIAAPVHRPAAGPVHRAHGGAGVVDPVAARLARSVGASAVLFVVLSVGALLYTSTGGSARELLVQELLVNLVIVLGLQVFIGKTGILSFGHLAFAQIAAYGAALATIPAATKATSLPDLPLGLGDVELGPFGAWSSAWWSPWRSARSSASPSPGRAAWPRR